MICAELTSTDADLWLRNPDDCAQRLSNQFQAFRIAIETCIYLLCLYRVIAFALALLVRWLVPRGLRERLTPPYDYWRRLSPTWNKGKGE
jgi:hypothetical protein